jgi:alkanesulfonate monooxygenase SsuD/methylene tetrahydromethanopterin reductase-like flavin-dependent oxidoreductase (luciferase family)
MHYDQVKDALYPDSADLGDFSYERVRRPLSLVRGEPASDFSGVEGFEMFSSRVQPHAPGLAARMWYGGASPRSAQWAGQQGMNFLTSSVVKAEEPGDFAEIQLSHIRRFRAHHPDGDRARVSQGLVVIPTDSASPAQRRTYEEFARKRLPRIAAPAVHLRARGLHPDPHRHRHQARPGPRLAAS